MGILNRDFVFFSFGPLKCHWFQIKEVIFVFCCCFFIQVKEKTGLYEEGVGFSVSCYAEGCYTDVSNWTYSK